MKSAMRAVAAAAAMMMLCAGAAASDDTSNTGNAGSDPAPTRTECIQATATSDAVDDKDCSIHGTSKVDSDGNCAMRLWCPYTRDPVTQRVTQYDILDWTGSLEDAARLDYVDRQLVVVNSE